MIFRPMEPDDAAAVTKLGELCFSEPWSYAAVCGELDNPRGRIFVCADGGEVLGYVSIAFVLDEGSINNLAVFSAHRRKGVADMLLDGLDQEAEKLKLAFMTLEVRASNAAARALYEKHGYRQVGLRKRFYAKPTEDAVLMTRFYTKGQNGI